MLTHSKMQKGDAAGAGIYVAKHNPDADPKVAWKKFASQYDQLNYLDEMVFCSDFHSARLEYLRKQKELECLTNKTKKQ